MMLSADEADRNGWRKYDNTATTWPEMTIEYYAKPPTSQDPPTISPAAATTSGGIWTNTTVPKISFYVADNPVNGEGSAYAKFQVIDTATDTTVWNNSDAAYLPLPGTSADGGTAYEYVPANKLTSGHTYKVRAWASADRDGNYLSAGYRESEFRVDTTPPQVTPATMAPADGSDLSVLPLSLSGTISGAAGVTLKGQFDIVDAVTGNAVGGPIGEGTSAATTGTSTYTPPAGALLANHAYRWGTVRNFV